MSTRTDTLSPYTTVFRSGREAVTRNLDVERAEEAGSQRAADALVLERAELRLARGDQVIDQRGAGKIVRRNLGLEDIDRAQPDLDAVRGSAHRAGLRRGGSGPRDRNHSV